MGNSSSANKKEVNKSPKSPIDGSTSLVTDSSNHNGDTNKLILSRSDKQQNCENIDDTPKKLPDIVKSSTETTDNIITSIANNNQQLLPGSLSPFQVATNENNVSISDLADNFNKLNVKSITCDNNTFTDNIDNCHSSDDEAFLDCHTFDPPNDTFNRLKSINTTIDDDGDQIMKQLNVTQETITTSVNVTTETSKDTFVASEQQETLNNTEDISPAVATTHVSETFYATDNTDKIKSQQQVNELNLSQNIINPIDGAKEEEITDDLQTSTNEFHSFSTNLPTDDHTFIAEDVQNSTSIQLTESIAFNEQPNENQLNESHETVVPIENKSADKLIVNDDELHQSQQKQQETEGSSQQEQTLLENTPTTTATTTTTTTTDYSSNSSAITTELPEKTETSIDVPPIVITDCNEESKLNTTTDNIKLTEPNQEYSKNSSFVECSNDSKSLSNNPTEEQTQQIPSTTDNNNKTLDDQTPSNLSALSNLNRSTGIIVDQLQTSYEKENIVILSNETIVSANTSKIINDSQSMVTSSGNSNNASSISSDLDNQQNISMPSSVSSTVNDNFMLPMEFEKFDEQFRSGQLPEHVRPIDIVPEKRLSIRQDLFTINPNETEKVTETVNTNNTNVTHIAASNNSANVFVNNLTDNLNVTFKAPFNTSPKLSDSSVSLPRSAASAIFNKKRLSADTMPQDEFTKGGMIYNPNDFDIFLQQQTGHQIDINRDSILLRFDPLLLGNPLNNPNINQQQLQQQQQQLGRTFEQREDNNSSNNTEEHQKSGPTSTGDSDSLNRTTPIDEELYRTPSGGNSTDELTSAGTSLNLSTTTSPQPSQPPPPPPPEPQSGPSTSSSLALRTENLVRPEILALTSQHLVCPEILTLTNQHLVHPEILALTNQNFVHPEILSTILANTEQGNEIMSLDIIKDMKIENDVMINATNNNSEQDIKREFKMTELEKKFKNEILKSEEIEKKLKDSEIREEALLKRITEKDKTIVKMSSVMEAYEKAIAELVAEKEKLIANNEKEKLELKTDRDLNFQHLMSLEATFSDLHVKYERIKQITLQQKASEDKLLEERKQIVQRLKTQEQRYDQMKGHCCKQLETANEKLNSSDLHHAKEVAILKALLKKEEVSKQAAHELLAQKTKENEELVKICDELIVGQGR